MKKILILLFLQGCIPNKNSLNVPFIKDQNGEEHYFIKIIPNNNNFCNIHGKWEYVEIKRKTQ
jgi:hypothetical protein